jgi:hypothetical protein
MKGMKRMFGRKKKNNSTPSTAADTQSQSEPLQPSADPVDTSRSNDTSSNTKTPAKDDGKRNKKNGRSPVDKKVNEVVVPQSGIEDRHATISKAYDSIPLLEQTKLPRGGISIETAAIGRVQVRLIVCFVCIVPYIISFFIYMNKSANYV